jgi:hypothetical protein
VEISGARTTKYASSDLLWELMCPDPKGVWPDPWEDVLLTRPFTFYFIHEATACIPKGYAAKEIQRTLFVVVPRSVYTNKRDPPSSAVRCAQVLGYELPLQQSGKKKIETKPKQSRAKIIPRPAGLPPFYRFPRHPHIYPGGVGSILICSVWHHAPHH